MPCYPAPRISSFLPSHHFTPQSVSSVSRATREGGEDEEEGKSNEVGSTYLQRLNEGWRGCSGPSFPHTFSSLSLSDTYSFKFTLLPSAWLLSHHVTCWLPCIFSLSVTFQKAFSSPLSSIFQSLSPFLLSSFVVTSFTSLLHPSNVASSSCVTRPLLSFSPQSVFCWCFMLNLLHFLHHFHPHSVSYLLVSYFLPSSTAFVFPGLSLIFTVPTCLSLSTLPPAILSSKTEVLIFNCLNLKLKLKL